MSKRYEVRQASSTGMYAIIDTIAHEVVKEVGVTSFAAREALAECDLLNDLDRNFEAQRHSAESFARLIRSTVN